MTNRAKILTVLGITLTVFGIGMLIKVFVLGKFTRPAALQVNSFPKAEVFLDEVSVGQTPYTAENLKAGDHKLRLRADLGGQPLVFISNVRLTPEALTYVNRELATTPEFAAGEILFLEKLPSGSQAEIAVISDPPGAEIKIDGGVSRELTPAMIKTASPGDHEISLALAGYKTRYLRGKVINGYRLNISVQLAKSPVTPSISAPPPPSATPAAELAKPYVVIKDTPTGWLRVRLEPTTTATEAAKINPGQKFPLILEQNDWLKIRYKDLLEGWISATYATVVK